jgi:hypothetical protein
MWIPSGGSYDWKFYGITAFPDLLSSKSTVAFDKIYPSPLNTTDHIGRALAFMGVKYVIYHNDSISYPNEELLQNLTRQRDLTVVRTLNGTVTIKDTSGTPLPVGIQVSDAPFHLSNLGIMTRGQISNFTMTYRVPQTVVDQGFQGQFWDGFGILVQGFPAGTVDLSTRQFFATADHQKMTSGTGGNASFLVEAPRYFPENSIDVYANFYDGSYRQISPLYFVARLKLVPDQMSNKYVVFGNSDFAGSVFSQSVGVINSKNSTELLRNNATISSSPSATITRYGQVSGVEWRVTADASAPFVLILTEPYDSLWRAYIGDREIKPTPIYGLVNGFLVDQVGTVSLRIYYTLQNYLTLGMITSVVSVLVSLVALTFESRKSRRTTPRYRRLSKLLAFR